MSSSIEIDQYCSQVGGLSYLASKTRSVVKVVPGKLGFLCSRPNSSPIRRGEASITILKSTLVCWTGTEL